MKTDSEFSASSPPGQPVWRQFLGWPSSRSGRWSLGFLVGFFVFFGLFQLLVFFGQRGGETFFSNLYLAFSMLIAVGSVIVAGVMAFIAIFWRRERSFLSFLGLLLGLLVLVFVIGELAFPH